MLLAGDKLHRRASSARRVIALARPELGRLALGTVFLAVGSAAGLLFPRAIGGVVDGAIGAGGGMSLDRAAGWLVVLFFIQAAASALRYWLFVLAGERVVARLRADLFTRLLAQETAFFDERRTGELTSRLASDTAVLEETVSSDVASALTSLASVVGGIAFLFYTSPSLTLVMLAVVPPVALGAVAYGRRVERLSSEAQDALAGAGEVAEEVLSGVRTVRAFAAEPIEAQRYTAAIWRSFEVARRRTALSAGFQGVASFAVYGALALVLWYGGRLVSAGVLTIGGLTSFLVYTLIVVNSLGGLSSLWAELMKATGTAERIFELFDRTPAMDGAGGLAPSRVEGRWEFLGVSFSYSSRPDAPVLQGLDLTLRPGEVTALVGPSGAGKSTIAALLLRLYDPTEGRVLLDGHDLRELSSDWLRRQISIVTQEPILFSCSIAENIRYGRPSATDAEVEAAARAANAHEFIARFPEGYRTRVGERGVQLSGGQKQRVAIARAVLKDPRVLVLDEATSALDAESEHLVQEALDRLMKGRTTLIIAHRLSTVKGADRVVVLDKGRVVQSGDHTSLLAEEGLYRRLVERQFASAAALPPSA